ncbi:MAG: hypothetical protein KME28_16140 [Pelatocladus maniniholoensis HA4357-MV3]|jgi:hypothetical protein|uniref:Uncharacterized protein n=1 Tax=Pelatocladus maniniholoensis HA4357-MV3 TaxID=1117104 RepID=A0A9E3HAS3_9NOST|nr:hypothetical protein [Pelatocladus maniniholoensis HA4357-MV3]
MLIYKRISYVQIGDEYQTYIHPVYGESFLRYKLLKNKNELEDALHKCQQAGWAVINATNLIAKMNSFTRKRPYH